MELVGAAYFANAGGGGSVCGFCDEWKFELVFELAYEDGLGSGKFMGLEEAGGLKFIDADF